MLSIWVPQENTLGTIQGEEMMAKCSFLALDVTVHFKLVLKSIATDGVANLSDYKISSSRPD